MHTLKRMDAVEPMQAAHRVEAAQPMQPLQRMQAVEAPMAPTHMNAAEPAQPLHRVEALQPMQTLHRMEAVEAPMARVEAVPVHENLARTASDSTMVSGVSMTSGTPVHQAVQPVQAHEMYSTADATPAEPRQPVSGFEQPMGPVQMSHTFEAPAARESYNPLQAHSVADPVQEGYNPLVADEPIQQAAAYDTLAQSGGAPVQPLRPTVAHERPTRPVQ
jgi:hypothetical protein